MYKSWVKTAVGVLFMVLLSQPVAQANSSLSKRFYVGVGISNTTLNINEANAMAKFPGNDEIFVGEDAVSLELLLGFKLDEYLSIEMGFVDLGTVTARNGVLTNKLLDVSSVFLDTSLEAKMSERVSLFGKIGVSLWNATYGSSYDSYEDGTGVVYGVGVDLNLYGGDERKLRFEWKRHDFDELFLEKADSVSMMLMINF